MNSGERKRLETLRTALKRRVAAHRTLRQADYANGSKHVSLELMSEGPTGLLKIDPEESALMILGSDGELLERQTLDLRFEEGFCWDEMVCSGPDELAGLILAHAERLLQRD